MATIVVNIKRGDEYDVYIGRAGHGESGYFGNPHTKGYVYCSDCHSHHDRQGAIEAFQKDFLKRIKEDAEYRRRILELRDKKLGCFCKPLACHGDIIKNWLDNMENF